MADASNPFDARRRRPRDWGDAFSNLPLETPPLSVWSQIEARLNASSETSADASAEAVVLRMPSADASTRPRSARRKLSNRSWLALAASLSALALLPLFWSNTRETSNTTSAPLANAVSMPAAGSVVDTGDATTTRATQTEVSPRDASAAVVASTAAARRSSAVDLPQDLPPRIESASPEPIVASATPASTDASPRNPKETPAPNDAAIAPVEVASVETPNDRDALPANAVLIGEADADATSREMELLYAASAQLETLLAYTRDPRVETGPAAALSSEIHSRLAKIDARLAQPGLSAHEQFALWQARVGTLRQAVAVESELRALSAEGQGYEGEVVEIY